MQNRFMRIRGAAALLAALLVLLVAFAAACGEDEAATGASAPTTAAPSAEPQPLLVAAAAAMKASFTELGPAFDAANNAKTTFTFDASGSLQTQIEAGAPIDVFASAAWKQMNNLLDQDLVDKASVVVFAKNEVVLAVPADSPLTITSIEELTSGEIERVAITDPETSPLGAAAVEVLTTLGILDALQPKLIYAKNVSQALTYVEQGEVDAGLMFATDAKAGGDKVKVVATSDPGWHGEIAFVLATVSAGESKTLAQTFIDFVLGPEGQAILNKHGFLSPPAS
ncbi:MAG: molybdate ABC transporter substrate-binding protein [Thermoleophilia bacterium]|nr:molybdate ABC transporter substrate-binding protein [Thermoleophilia bacterium]